MRDAIEWNHLNWNRCIRYMIQTSSDLFREPSAIVGKFRNSSENHRIFICFFHFVECIINEKSHHLLVMFWELSKHHFYLNCTRGRAIWVARQLLTTSNFSGPWYHAALLFSGLGSIVLLFGVLFSQQIREDLVRAATSPCNFLYLLFLPSKIRSLIEIPNDLVIITSVRRQYWQNGVQKRGQWANVYFHCTANCVKLMKLVRFFVYNTFNKMKETDEDSVIFRRIPKFADDCRRIPKKIRRCFDHISYISQSPWSRVQSPESSAGFKTMPE